MPNLTIKFNILLDPPLYDALKQTAELTGISRGLVARYAISFYHAMVVAGIPTCASGQRCYCPQLHSQAGTALAPPLLQAAVHPPSFPDKPAPVETPHIVSAVAPQQTLSAAEILSPDNAALHDGVHPRRHK